MAGVEDAGAPAHRLPPGTGRLGRIGLAEDLPVELEHRVATDHDALETLCRESVGDVGGFPPREKKDVFVGWERATLGGFGRRDDRFLIDLRSPGGRFDADLAQQHEASGGGGGEAHAHTTTVAGRRRLDGGPRGPV